MTLQERISSGIDRIHGEGTAFRHIKHTLSTGKVGRIKGETKVDTWAFVMRMDPTGSSGHAVKVGLMVFLAGLHGRDDTTVADALLSASHAMELEIQARYDEHPHLDGLVPAAWTLAETVRLYGCSLQRMIVNLKNILPDRHPDQGTLAVIQFLEGFSGN